MSRFGVGRITARQATEIVAAALAVQADADKQIGDWGDLFAQAYKLGVVKTRELDLFLLGSMVFELAPRATVGQGDPVPFEIRFTWRGASYASRPTFPSSDVTQAIDVSLRRISLSGQTAGPVPTPGVFVPRSFGMVSGYSFVDPAQIKGWQLPIANAEPGVRQFQVEVTVGLKPGYGPMAPSFPEGPVGYATPRELVLSAPITVAEKKTAAALLVSDPTLRKIISEKLESSIWGLRRDQAYLSLHLTSGKMPDACNEFAFRVILAINGREFPLSAVSLGGSWFNTSSESPLTQEALQALTSTSNPEIRVILRPSNSAASQTLRAARFLDGGDIELQPTIENR